MRIAILRVIGRKVRAGGGEDFIGKMGRQYPLNRTGLLLTGPSGVGKTHLGVAALREVVKKGIHSRFCDYRELLKQIQNSYNPSVQATELDVLKPVFEAKVLLLDDLGAVKPSEWVWDTVSLVLNTRYNDNLTTIITTNFMDGPASGVGPRGLHARRRWGTGLGRECGLGCLRCAGWCRCRGRTTGRIFGRRD